jgi:hypothetical protein
LLAGTTRCPASQSFILALLLRIRDSGEAASGLTRTVGPPKYRAIAHDISGSLPISDYFNTGVACNAALP